MPHALSLADREKLSAALAEVNPASLLLSVEQAFGKPLDLIAPGAAVADAPAKLVQWAHEYDRTDALLIVVRNVPRTPKVAEFLMTYGAGDPQALQKALNPNNLQLFDSIGFAVGLLERIRQVCRVMVDGVPYGTGVLIGPSTVLTAHHVIEKCLDDDDKAIAGSSARVHCVFDKYMVPGSPQQTPELTIPAANDWLGPHCRAHPKEGAVELPDPPDALCLLDYAVINLAEPVGTAPLSANGGAPRGWLDLSKAQDEALVKGTPLVIVQQPEGMKVHHAIGPFDSLDQRKSRIRYGIDTLHRSSGSPCFNSEFQPVALHNAALPPGIKLNQGVPLGLIRKHIEERGGPMGSPSVRLAPVWRLASGAPVFGRAQLQQLAWSLRDPKSPKRILAVRGEKGSGRSFSVEIVKSLFASASNLVVERTMESLQDKAPDSFLVELARDLKLPVDAPARPTDRQSSRWANTVLLDWFRSSYSKAYPREGGGAFTVWVTLDNFDRYRFKSDESLELLVQLMRATPGLETLRWLLIGAAPDPSLVEASVVVEELVEPVTDDEVIRFLKGVRDADEKAATDAQIERMGPALRVLAQAKVDDKTPLLRALQTLAADFARGLA